MSDRGFVFAVLIATSLPTLSYAISPQSISAGARLFRQNWEARNPALGNDGLGPLFNATSCATCHRQGGVGGGGEAIFNAKSIGIESIEISGGSLTNLSLAELVSRFHPGFVQSEGRIVNSLPLPHHGGSEIFRQFHDAMTLRTTAQFSDEGGPLGAEEVRIANSQPIVFEQRIDGFKMRISARMFERNTPALFGSGLIDQVPNELLDQQTRLQSKHVEISGRPSTLSRGRYGKFGWRANVASLVEFTDQACASEMGLQTKRKTQESDATNPLYRNNSIDITDEQVKFLADFVTSLPSPRQRLRENHPVAEVRRGQAAFTRVGCAVCHVRDMNPAVGIYSDLLLHDMGADSIDLNHAEPYVVDRELVLNEVNARIPQGSIQNGPTPYYGTPSMITLPDGSESSFAVATPPRFARSNGQLPQPSFTFLAPSQPSSLFAFRLVDSELNPGTKNNPVARFASQRFPAAAAVLTRKDLYERSKIQPTMFNQEWRTAPLWGLRDSAPYLHDGRAETVLEAIAMHEGEAAGTRDRFLALSYEDRQAILTFLDTLSAPQVL